jgi:hypothetical protein
MHTSSRLYHCCLCHAQVIICLRCDRGQRYCPDGCSQKARKVSVKRAGKKYQSTRPGRFNNAKRQQQYRQRQRQKQKVTHHSSPPTVSCAVLRNTRNRLTKAPAQQLTETILHCAYCGAVCGPFLRSDFLQNSHFKQGLRRKRGKHDH